MMKIVFFKSCHLKQVCRYQQINLNLEAACTELDRVEVRESPSARRRTGAAPPSCFGGGFAVCIYRKRRDLVRENLPHSSTKRGWLRQNHYVTALPSSNSRMNPWRPRALTSRRGKINRHYFIIFARRNRRRRTTEWKQVPKKFAVHSPSELEKPPPFRNGWSSVRLYSIIDMFSGRWRQISVDLIKSCCKSNVRESVRSSRSRRRVSYHQVQCVVSF